MEKQNFTRVPNDFLEHLAKKNIPQHSWRCLIFIIRKSWGWNQPDVELRNNDFGWNPGQILALFRAEKKKVLYSMGKTPCTL